MPKNLGKIKKVDLREVFANEASDFTPWLQENADRLAEAVGMEITDIKREEGIGNFSCDLIGIEANTDDKIIIENQLETTNHDHLGKIITYASGIGAKYIIWIAKKIRDEHQKALEWLNENTESSLSFFGIEVSAMSIDDSRPAVHFEVIVEPNAWSKEIQQKNTRIDERHQKYLQFFTRLVSEYERVKPSWGHLTPSPASWLAFGAGRAGFKFVWSMRGNNQFAVELYIDTGDQDEIKMYFGELQSHSDEINRKISDLQWEELSEKRASRIAVYYTMPTSIKNLTSEQIDKVIQWGIEKMDLFKKVFPSYIRKLEN